MTKRTQSQVGRMSRNKGAAYELRIAKKLSLWWTHDQVKDAFRRTPMSGGWDKRYAAGDLIAPEPSFPIHIEIRKRETFSVGSFLKAGVVLEWWMEGLQARKDLSVRLWYFMSRNHEVDYLVMNTEDWRFIQAFAPLSTPDHLNYVAEGFNLTICLLDDFLKAISPETVREVFCAKGITRKKKVAVQPDSE